jgi:hypothetical protein
MYKQTGATLFFQLLLLLVVVSEVLEAERLVRLAVLGVEEELLLLKPHKPEALEIRLQ